VSGAPLEPTRYPGVYRRGDKYAYRFTDPDGKRKQGTAATLKAAVAARTAKQAKVATGEYHEPSRALLGEYTDAWVATQQHLRPYVRVEYQRNLDAFVKKVGRARPLGTLRARDVEDYLRVVAGRTTSDATVRNAWKPIRRMLQDARRLDGISDIVGRVQVPKVPARKPIDLADIPSDEQVAAIIAHSPVEWRVLVQLVAETGLRISEALALSWGDVGDCAVRVRRGVVKGTIAEPKTRAARRSVPLTAGVARQLRERRVFAELAHGRSGDDDLVFATTTGKPYDRCNLQRRVPRPAMLAAGIDRKGWGWHCLRHYVASKLIARGEPITRVAAWLGHASPAITLGIYAHVVPGDAPMLPLEAPLGVTQGSHNSTEPGGTER
jgi:integrase